MTHLQVQKALIAVFIHHDRDELITARPAAYQSYRNHVERCHAIANLGLQGVGIMRTQMAHNMECLMKKCNGNEDVHKQCESNDEFRDAYRASIKEARELLEYILQKLALKENTFKILPPADENDINCYVNTELDKIDSNLKDLKSHEGISKHALLKNFFETNVRRRSYFFQIRKCTDLNCKFHEKLRGADEIT